MIEKVMLDYLNSKLDVDVFMERPETPPDSYVVIEKTGSSKSDQIMTSVMAFSSYAKSLYDAASLNEEVKDAVEDFAELIQVGGVHLNSDYNFTNTNAKQYRYQAIFLITHY